MAGLTTVVVVHETGAPDIRRLFALCAEHLQVLDRAAWARVDEMVGSSAAMQCEACPLIGETLPETPLPSVRTRTSSFTLPVPEHRAALTDGAHHPRE